MEGGQSKPHFLSLSLSRSPFTPIPLQHRPTGRARNGDIMVREGAEGARGG